MDEQRRKLIQRKTEAIFKKAETRTIAKDSSKSRQAVVIKKALDPLVSFVSVFITAYDKHRSSCWQGVRGYSIGQNNVPIMVDRFAKVSCPTSHCQNPGRSGHFLPRPDESGKPNIFMTTGINAGY